MFLVKREINKKGGNGKHKGGEKEGTLYAKQHTECFYTILMICFVLVYLCERVNGGDKKGGGNG